VLPLANSAAMTALLFASKVGFAETRWFQGEFEQL